MEPRIPSTEVAAVSLPGAPFPASGPLTGEVVYLFAYDVAYELSREPIARLLDQPVAQYNLDSSRRSPRHLLSYKPQLIRLPTQERLGPHGPVRVEREIKILPIGALSIRVRIPFSVNSLAELVNYHDFQFSNGVLYDEIRELAETLRRELAPYIIRPNDRLPDEEAYTVFCLHGPLTNAQGQPLRAEAWLETNRRAIAQVLTQEPGSPGLSRQEAVESTSRHLSYYEDDLVVIDWDAALLVDQAAEWEETLYVLELANLQLAELEAYDRLLDLSLERTYRDLGSAVRGRRQLLRELRELRIDLTRFNDELSNISKFFGDWHVARVYETVAARFHLGDWHRSVDTKLRAVAELHELLKHDQMNRWMMILEVTIVLLFIIDLVILFAGRK
jgi:hypothetical protein